MQQRRIRPGGRRPRRARLVDLSKCGMPAIYGEEAQAWIVGLEAAQLLKTHFPAFYFKHAVALPASLPQMLGCAGAFWQLVEVEGLSLRMPGEEGWFDAEGFEVEATPEQTLHAYDGVLPEFMNGTIAHYVAVPRPHYYGLGVETMLEEEPSPDLLTATLWRLFQGTSWAIIDMGDPTSGIYSNIDEEVAAQIARLKPLPSDANLSAIANRVKLPGAPSSTGNAWSHNAWALLAYAVGQTENTLADSTDYEAEAIHMGDLDEGWSWEHLQDMIEIQREARQIWEAYEAWAGWLSMCPHKAIPQLAGALHKADRAHRAELAAKPEPSLISMLAEAGMLGQDGRTVSPEEL